MHGLQDLGISEYLQDKPVENTKMCFPRNSKNLGTTTHGSVRVKGVLDEEGELQKFLTS